MRFRSALLLCTLALIAGMVTVTVIAVSVIIERAEKGSVVEDLRRAMQSFAELSTHRDSLLIAKARVLANEPRLKALLATADISSRTVDMVARELRDALEADLFVVADTHGQVLSEIGDPDISGKNIADLALVAGALELGTSSGMWVQRRGVYQVQAVRIGFAERIIGVAVIGYLLDEEVTTAVYRLTATSVVIQVQDRVISLSPLENPGVLGFDTVALALSRVATDDPHPVVVQLAGVRYMALAARFPGLGSDPGLRYVVLRSLDRALAPSRAFLRVLFVSMVVVLPVILLIALWVAHRLARPIDRLVAFTDQVASGELGARASVEGVLELAALAQSMNHMVERLEMSQQHIAAKERLEQEMEIAATIQTSILPRKLYVAGLDIAAQMEPATEVGGDYYDVLVRERCWIAIGDVAGHGVPAGLIMMMLQNILSAMVKVNPYVSPTEICCGVNEVLVDNVHDRLQRNEHVTLTLFRYDGGGKMIYAGAHEDIVIRRARTGRCETVATTGTWLGVMPDIWPFTEDRELVLQPGDVMVLHTDGVTEARNREQEMFGMERLCAELERAPRTDADAICRHIMDAARGWTDALDDDMTVLVLVQK